MATTQLEMCLQKHIVWRKTNAAVNGPDIQAMVTGFLILI